MRFTFGTVINCCPLNRVDHGFLLLSGIIKCGLTRGFCPEGFMEIKASNCFPSDITYNTLVHGYFDNKKYDEGFEV